MNEKQEVKRYKVALLGNPNTGKSSVFNQLTGLRQKIGNFPGVTVDKKVGNLLINPSFFIDLIDFPGTYSFYPNSLDERIVVQTMSIQRMKITQMLSSTLQILLNWKNTYYFSHS